jgi:hypothetical protein
LINYVLHRKEDEHSMPKIKIKGDLFIIRNMPPGLRKSIRGRALEEDKSANALIIEILQAAISKEGWGKT